MLLHELADGPADRSYGLAVARLAGVPAGVVKRAEAVLAKLEAGREKTGGLAAGLDDLPLFAATLAEAPYGGEGCASRSARSDDPFQDALRRARRWRRSTASSSFVPNRDEDLAMSDIFDALLDRRAIIDRRLVGSPRGDRRRDLRYRRGAARWLRCSRARSTMAGPRRSPLLDHPSPGRIAASAMAFLDRSNRPAEP